MKGRRWTLWAVATAGLALAAMVLCLAPSGADFTALNRLPAPMHSESVPMSGERINVNTADLETLMKLPNVGEVRARAIIDYRNSHGLFRYPEELFYVPGIGEGTLNGLLDLITTGGE